jgi:hypothetical protein
MQMNEFVGIVYRNVAKTNFELAGLESVFRDVSGLTALRVRHNFTFRSS